jgi:hypothetical protein
MQLYKIQKYFCFSWIFPSAKNWSINFAVLNLLIGSSFKSGSVLKRLELKEESVRRPFFVVEEFKGKSRVINLKANIEIPTRQDQVKVGHVSSTPTFL